MGKRRKRLTLAKYANKYAKLRESVLGVKNQVQEVVEETIEAVTEAVTEVVTEKLEKVDEILDGTQKRINALKQLTPEKAHVEKAQEIKPTPPKPSSTPKAKKSAPKKKTPSSTRRKPTPKTKTDS
tara:strand:+ start:208 stop:585 length:378 start_codon:yes stop_codon:yes gene_type:complete